MGGGVLNCRRSIPIIPMKEGSVVIEVWGGASNVELKVLLFLGQFLKGRFPWRCP